MTYLQLGCCVAAASVLAPGVLGALVSGRRIISTIVVSIVAAMLYGLVWTLAAWGSSAGFYPPLPFFGSLFVGLLLSTGVAMFSRMLDDYGANGRGVVLNFLAALAVAVAMLFVVFDQSMDWGGNGQAKAKLIGEIKTVVDVNQAMKPADTAHICLVDEGMAKKKANAALSSFRVGENVIAGSRFSIGTPTKQFVAGQLWWIFPVEFQGWQKWRTGREVPGYLRVSAEDPFAEAEAVQLNKQGEPLALRYLNSACWEYKGVRRLRYNGYMFSLLLDWTFEVDDDWNPYYTVTFGRRAFGYSATELTGLIVMNLQSGEFKLHQLNDVPAWIDRVAPLEVIDYNLTKWGRYAQEGWWYNFWHDDKAQQPTPGWFLTYDPSNGAQWFTGFTSTNSADSAMTGFTLTNARTMSTTFYQAKGTTEDVAYRTARSLWSLYEGYEPSELVPYNIDGVLTYVIPMKFENQFKGVSLVSLANYEINGSGDALAEALADYRDAVVNAQGNRTAPEGGQLQHFEIAGTIERIGIPVPKGKTLVIPFTLAGISKRFQVSDSFKFAESVFMQSGDQVVIGYLDTLEPSITVDQFDLEPLSFSDERPAQARLTENLAAVKTETDRVEAQAPEQTGQ